jgi:hypothetical protein
MTVDDTARRKRLRRAKRPKIPADWPEPHLLPMQAWRGLQDPEYIAARQWQVCEGCGNVIEEGELCVRQAMTERYLFACCPACHLTASQKFDDMVRERDPITETDIRAMF